MSFYQSKNQINEGFHKKNAAVHENKFYKNIKQQTVFNINNSKHFLSSKSAY